MSADLSARQRAVLAAVCETLLPELDVEDDPEGLFATGAVTANTLARVEGLIADLPNRHDRVRLRTLLSTLDSRVANLALGGAFKSFARLDPPERERTLLAWAHSRVPLKRVGFQALKRLIHFAYACWPLSDGSHPAWRAAGYPGPLPQPAKGVDALPTVTVDRDTTLECDVVVVGSGAGGGVVAGLLAEAGRSVIVLEKGGNPSAADMTQVEGDMFRSLFLDGGTLMTQSGSMPVLAGTGLGGGTTINWTTSFPVPEQIRAEWAERSGLPFFTGRGFADSLDRVLQRLNVGTQWSTPSERDLILERGCKELGWQVDAIPRNVTDCREGLECGYCGYGCRHGAKNSTARTYLHDAAGAGAQLVVHCEVDRILSDGKRATGVVGRVGGANGAWRTLTVNARAVVAACGAIYTPALLRRSGLTNPSIGRNLHLHPVTAVAGFFPDRVEPWGGALQTRYCEEHAYLDGNYGFRFETGPIHFGLPSSAFGWEGARRWREDISRLGHTSVIGILLRDRDAGRVNVLRSGQPRVHYELSAYDVKHARRSLQAAAQVLAAAGASELFTLQTPPTRVRTDQPGWLGRFIQDADRTGYRYARMSYITFHQMGTATMGHDPAHSVIGESGECHEMKGLYVADGSAFPTSSGVNPMITIMAIADHVARAIDESL